MVRVRPRVLFLFGKILFLISLAMGLGCASTPTVQRSDIIPGFETPESVFKYTCGDHGPGFANHGVTGSLWLKAKSNDASGQFPAQVVARSLDELDLEVTNLLGAPQASLQVRGEVYQLKVENRIESGRSAWGGIPLKWATALFFGRVPCPTPARQKDMKLSLAADGALRVDLPAALEVEPETFVYQYRQWGREPWPQSLVWEKRGTVPFKVEFKFEDPEDPSRSPKRWEARSTLGEVKARWKDREIQK